VRDFPVVLLDSAYWAPLLEWVRGPALAEGMVAAEDYELLTVTDDPQIALRTVLDGSARVNSAGPAAPVGHDAQ